MIMERTKKSKTVIGILTADWHVREDIPVCRSESFQDEFWAKVDFVAELQRKFDCPVFHGGDLFHFWKPSPWLLTQCHLHFPKNFYTIYGQHDLPQHNFDLRIKSGIHNLEQAGLLKVLDGCSWGQDPKDGTFSKHSWWGQNWKILVWHVFNYQGRPPWPGCEAMKGLHLLKKYPQYDLILTGDNHTPFVEYYEGRVLVNPGSLSRQEAGQADFQPRVYLYYSDNSVEPIFIPIKQDAVSRDHLINKEERDGRIDAFISRLKDNWEIGISFEENIARLASTNKVRKSVMDIVYKSIE